MLTANVLCLKKRKKKKGEYILNLPTTILTSHGKGKGPKAGNMLHITEDTPADMLAGAMDLTIHLPTGKTVKMCVERRTPMMDLLVQVTTNHQLQITNYTLQPLQTSSGDGDRHERVLSYYPNTPIGALDTQHIRVIPKTRTLPSSKNAQAVQHQQPFETTFRLKVHLPRNQLYVTRVSKHVHIGDIMREVCEEKSLDPNKYEVRHPGNLDEILDPKLTLNDYMITEINLVVKGSNTKRQTFTSEDIMSLKKEEERKSSPNKTGGVFNLLFRRGKSNNLPAAAAPPPIKEPPITTNKEEPLSQPPSRMQPVTKQEPQKEKPKVPQRKRRPAPKPPQLPEKVPQQLEKEDPVEPVQLRNGSIISDSSNVSEKDTKESGVIICHSRHSSDSSGYHETSILSDQCNTSLPRRNRLGEGDTMGRLKLNRYSESTGNLTKMTSHSRSTSSLIFPGRKKKAAPPPPNPLHKPTSSTTNLESLSPLVASQTHLSASSSKTDLSLASQGTQKTTNPPPVPRRRKGPVPTPPPQNTVKEEENSLILDDTSQLTEESLYSCPYQTEGIHLRDTPDSSRPPSNMSTIDILKSLEYLNLDEQGNEIKPPEIIGVLPKKNQTDDELLKEETQLPKRTFILNLVDQSLDDDNTSVATESPMKNELNSIVSDVSSVDVPLRKKQLVKELSVTSVKSSESALFEEGQMRRWGSWEKLNLSSVASSPIDESPRLSSEECLKENTKSIKMSKDSEIQIEGSSQFEIIDNLEVEEKPNVNAVEDLMRERVLSEDIGRIDTEKQVESVLSETDFSSTSSHPGHKVSEKSCTNILLEKPIEEKENIISAYTSDVINEISLDDVEKYKNYGNSPDSGNSSEISEKSKIEDELACPEILDVLATNDEAVIEEWQLPSPPKAFKDTCPNSRTTETTEIDSVITAELIEKLERIEKEQMSNKESCGEDDLILSKLTLENLEKRKSLVYNRELATSLKQSYESEAAKKEAGSFKPTQPLENIEKPKVEVRTTEKKEPVKETKHNTLPNFKITTYEEPKQIKVFEDDTIRSNSDFSGKSLSLNRGTTLQKNVFGTSMENVKNDEPKDVEHRMFRPLRRDHYRRPVNRSGSFSVDQNEWSSTRPVARSKSQVALRRGDIKSNAFEAGGMSKSNSLFDVSGLQSLEVMKKIQNKLNTPTASMETLSRVEPKQEAETKPKAEIVEEIPKKKYQYTGPPSINMGTWSDRPKVPVSVKEDADYKLGQGTNKRFGSQTLDSRTNRYTNGVNSKTNEQRVTITCNGTSENHKDFNVLIKIEDHSRRHQEQPVDPMYKTSYRSTQRPHSMAFPSDFDISRVPVVRSVELKKNFRDIQNNTSIIQLNQSNDGFYSNGYMEKNHETNVVRTEVAKPVLRAKSFLQTAPVVRGFRTLENSSDSTNNVNCKVENFNRFSWQPTTSTTPPAKDTFTTNRNVPFSRLNLRRTESKASRDDLENNNRIESNDFKSPLPVAETNGFGNSSENSEIPKPPPQVPKPVQKKISVAETNGFGNSSIYSEIPKPPPQMPKPVQKKISNRQFVPVVDPRDELLKSIRDFGGKKGLRSRKA